MPEKLEEKAEESKTLNDKFKKGKYQEIQSPKLHDYFLKITPNFSIYPENILKTFTP
ncbi:MAG: hypothetical protein NTZ83_06035 [Candidatus Pacearchaeota archaeon]|nr:hypothetical protein [Candidatus Pacearchaeota archaeon]